MRRVPSWTAWHGRGHGPVRGLPCWHTPEQGWKEFLRCEWPHTHGMFRLILSMAYSPALRDNTETLWFASQPSLRAASRYAALLSWADAPLIIVSSAFNATRVFIRWAMCPAVSVAVSRPSGTPAVQTILVCAAAGSYSPRGASTCTLCEPGRYGANPGQAICLSCPPGTESLEVNQTECASCKEVCRHVNRTRRGC